MAGPEEVLSKRRYPRRNFYRHVSVLYKGQYFMGRGCEIGEGGMLIEVSEEIAKEKLILVNFMIDEKMISVQSEVRSIQSLEKSNQYGLLFLNLSYEGRKAIREFIAAKSEEESLAEIQMAKEAS